MNESQKLALSFDITAIHSVKGGRVREAFIARLGGCTLVAAGKCMGVGAGRARGLIGFAVRVAMTEHMKKVRLANEMQQNPFEWDFKDIKSSGLSGVEYKLRMLDVVKALT